jgi:uncharacterized membrane protein YkvA (DUF1232 family)
LAFSRNSRSKWKLIWNLPQLLKKTWALLKNPHVPGERKIIFLLLALAYFLWPLDLIPDFPLLGQLDDLGILFLLMNWFVSKSPKKDPEAIEADYYVIDQDQEPPQEKES